MGCTHGDSDDDEKDGGGMLLSIFFVCVEILKIYNERWFWHRQNYDSLCASKDQRASWGVLKIINNQKEAEGRRQQLLLSKLNSHELRHSTTL